MAEVCALQVVLLDYPIAVIDLNIHSFILYLLTKSYIPLYCHVQREQDNKAQITGTNIAVALSA